MYIDELRKRLLGGLVIPACPLPLDEQRKWSPRHQRAITRYYAAAGAGGIAVGVHSTQFEIREPGVGLLEPVLGSVAETLSSCGANSMIKIAGICGRTSQANAEAELALRHGYHAGLLSMTAFTGEDEATILSHCRNLADTIPIVGFYLQPAVGGQVFSFQFWQQFAEIENVVAIKIAPFNRYQTWDVVRAVIQSGRDDVALYTGNDDNIIADLITPFVGQFNGQTKRRFMNGGLLGQWGVWTRRAVQLLESIKVARQQPTIDTQWLADNIALTDANAAIFDSANQFSGCIPGIMEVLRRNGLAPSNCCLNPNEKLSDGQANELDRVATTYPQLVDAQFVASHLDEWLD